MVTGTIHKLLDRTRSFLSVYDESGVLRYLKSSWTVPDLIKLLAHRNPAVVKVAATCLGIWADPVATSALTASLSHGDAIVSTMAEFSLWTIWFKERGPAAEALLRGVSRMNYSQAIGVLEALADKYPDWAEPYHQRAIINFKEHLFISSVDDCKETLALQEHHFGAWACLGRAYTQLGLYSQALSCFRRALQIHPRLGGVRQSLRTIRELTGKAQLS